MPESLLSISTTAAIGLMTCYLGYQNHRLSREQKVTTDRKLSLDKFEKRFSEIKIIIEYSRYQRNNDLLSDILGIYLFCDHENDEQRIDLVIEIFEDRYDDYITELNKISVEIDLCAARSEFLFSEGTSHLIREFSEALRDYKTNFQANLSGLFVNKTPISEQILPFMQQFTNRLIEIENKLYHRLANNEFIDLSK